MRTPELVFMANIGLHLFGKTGGFDFVAMREQGDPKLSIERRTEEEIVEFFYEHHK